MSRVRFHIVRAHAGLLVLDLADTYVAQHVPDAPTWSQLRVLSLRNTRLSGTIPPWVVQLPALELLDLGQNDFSGTLPPFSTAPRVLALTSFTVDSAGLSGGLPDGWSSAPRLEVLELGGNNFSGPLFSSSLCARAPSLRRLAVAHNDLSGPWAFLLESCANVSALGGVCAADAVLLPSLVD